MMIKHSLDRWLRISALVIVAGVALACAPEATSETAAPSTTAGMPSGDDLLRSSESHPPLLSPTSAALPVPGARHLGHFSNKPSTKRLANATEPQEPATVSAEHLARQAAYLKSWHELQPTIARLSPEEQAARQAALKQSMLGN